ncbi:LPXTG cell wall anchor domain-containing protein [Candidatus Woesearchaeota archaeon]|nr:LPXTG cell wall anchor domain-containing protein [Candidatus Woesearchaeota archaeon]
MKTNKLIISVLILGYLVLLFFPNPEDNFIAYFSIMLLFIAIIIFLLKKRKKKLRPVK